MTDPLTALHASKRKATRQRENWKSRAMKYREALEFYADPANWQSPSHGFALQYDPEPSPVEKDKGERARRAVNVRKGSNE